MSRNSSAVKTRSCDCESCVVVGCSGSGARVAFVLGGHDLKNR